MTAITAALLAVLAITFEHREWRWPEPPVWFAIAYNAVGVFGFAHAAWFYLARGMPPVASGISVMLIPVLGTFAGAGWLGEVLHWEDYAAMVAIVVAIALVLRR
jgi:drug/metabolite transporter (DMT)-like permease